jgi:uncharacterized protein YmfQ (DUF2313 family)
MVDTPRQPPKGNLTLSQSAPNVVRTTGIGRATLRLMTTAPTVTVAWAGEVPAAPLVPHSGDKHVTRTGDEYAHALQNHLPIGQAWPRAEESTLMKVVRGLTKIWGDLEIRASHLLEQESDPRITIELLPDWERNWGLPDPCYEAPQSIAERQAALVLRMTMVGGCSRQFFIDLAATLGYTITITEYRPFFIAMDRCGDSRVYGAGVTTDTPMRNEWGQPILAPPGDHEVANGQLSAWPHYGLGPLANRYYWSVHVGSAKLVWFRCTSGQCGVDPHLRIGIADDLECVLERWKPGHTEVVFDYSGLTGTGDPMAGTP